MVLIKQRSLRIALLQFIKRMMIVVAQGIQQCLTIVFDVAGVFNLLDNLDNKLTVSIDDILDICQKDFLHHQLCPFKLQSMQVCFLVMYLRFEKMLMFFLQISFEICYQQPTFFEIYYQQLSTYKAISLRNSASGTKYMQTEK